MATSSREQLKAWFQKGKKPLASQFASWIDSFWHKNDSMPMSSITGLLEALNQRTITVDSEINDTSVNPVQNKIISAALRLLAPLVHTHTLSDITDSKDKEDVDSVKVAQFFQLHEGFGNNGLSWLVGQDPSDVEVTDYLEALVSAYGDESVAGCLEVPYNEENIAVVFMVDTETEKKIKFALYSEAVIVTMDLSGDEISMVSKRIGDVNIEFDNILDNNSENAVQNKVIVEALSRKMNTFGRDTDAVQDNRKSFVYRTSAGTQSISDGDAKLTELFGNVENGIPFSASSFRAVKFNLFNPVNVISGHKLNTNGTIEASSGHTLAIVHVLPATIAAGANNGYRVRNKTNKTCTVNRVGYSSSYPTEDTVASVLSEVTLPEATSRKVYAPSNLGYMIIDVASSEINNLLVHIAWSYDPTDKNEDYSDSVIEIPAIHEWGMGKAQDAMDEINLLDQVAKIRVDRALLSSMTWEEEETEHHEDPEDSESGIISITYKYKSNSLADSIKAGTVNLDCYGLNQDYSLIVDADGVVVIDTGEEHILNPAEEFAGIYLYYELAVMIVNPITMELLYSVGDFGTEEFVETVVAPYYATFFYLTNNEDTIRNLAIVQENSRSYTIDFNENRTVVQERNIQSDIAIRKIVTDNVTTLKLSKNGGAVQTLPLASGVWEGTINVSEGDLLVWQILRTTENSIAEINIKYEY